MKDKQKDEVYTKIHDIVTSNIYQKLDKNGEATYTLDDEDRENIENELLEYFTK